MFGELVCEGDGCHTRRRDERLLSKLAVHVSTLDTVRVFSNGNFTLFPGRTVEKYSVAIKIIICPSLRPSILFSGTGEYRRVRKYIPRSQTIFREHGKNRSQFSWQSYRQNATPGHVVDGLRCATGIIAQGGCTSREFRAPQTLTPRCGRRVDRFDFALRGSEENHW